MNEIQFTLLADGPSDRALVPILKWLLSEALPNTAIQSECADFRYLPSPPRSLMERIRKSIEYFPCQLLFVHRDAESVAVDARRQEIDNAIHESGEDVVPVVCVIPVRMTEAWLLIDEHAIRFASGNPNGRMELPLPKLAEVETLQDPKRMLHELLCKASGLRGRRLNKFVPHQKVPRVGEFCNDFNLLRRLPAFRAMEDQLTETLRVQNWTGL